MKTKSLCLMYALGGALVGAAIAMLATPQTGKELRGKIRNAVNDTMAEMCHTHGVGCECNHTPTANE